MQFFIFAVVSSWPQRPGAGFWQIDERADLGLQRGELRVESAAACRNKPGANTGAEMETVASVEANQDSIEAVSPWRLAADDKLLRKLDPHLGPSAGASSLFVGA